MEQVKNDKLMRVTQLPEEIQFLQHYLKSQRLHLKICHKWIPAGGRDREEARAVCLVNHLQSAAKQFVLEMICIFFLSRYQKIQALSPK